MDRSRFTPVELRMLDVLADGMPHTRRELHACLEDDLGSLSNVQRHVHSIRKKLRPSGQDVVCVWSNGPVCYRQVRLLASAGSE